MQVLPGRDQLHTRSGPGVESIPPIDFLAAAGAAQCVSVKLAVGGNLMSAGDTEQLGQPSSIAFH